MLKCWNVGMLDLPRLQGLIAPFFPIIPSFPYSIIPLQDVHSRFCGCLKVTASTPADTAAAGNRWLRGNWKPSHWPRPIPVSGPLGRRRFQAAWFR